MPHIAADRVQETTATVGTGPYVVSGAEPSFQTWLAAVGNGNSAYYAINDEVNWEVGETLLSGGNTLARTVILASSNGGAAVNWGAGNKTIFLDYPATRSVFVLPSGQLNVPYISMSDVPPANPIKGQMWWESDTGNSFVWYEDANSAQWVPSNVGVGGSGGGGGGGGLTPIAANTYLGNETAGTALPAAYPMNFARLPVVNKFTADNNWFNNEIDIYGTAAFGAALNFMSTGDPGTSIRKGQIYHDGYDFQFYSRGISGADGSGSFRLFPDSNTDGVVEVVSDLVVTDGRVIVEAFDPGDTALFLRGYGGNSIIDFAIDHQDNPTPPAVRIESFNLTDGELSIKTLAGGTTLAERARITTKGIVVPDQAYGPTWDGDFSAPTKNALWDKIETIAGGGGVSGLTPGGVTFGAAGGTLAQDATNVFWDDTNDRLGVGTNTPIEKLHVDNGTVVSRRYGLGGVYFADSAGGTKAAPTAVTGSKNVGYLIGRGFDGTNYKEIGSITFVTDGDVTPTVSGGSTVFYNTIAGGSATRENMRINSSGWVGIGTAVPASRVHINDGTITDTNFGNAALLTLQRANGTRSSPTQVVTPNNVSIIASQAYTGSVYRDMSYIATINDGAVTSTSAPGSIALSTTPVNTIVPVERMRVTSVGDVGIGTNAPASRLHVDDGYITTRRYGSSAAVVYESAGGTRAAPTAIAGVANVAYMGFNAYDGAAYRNVGSININSAGPVTPTSAPGNMVFYTTPTGSVTTVERLRIDSAGRVGIGWIPGSNDATLEVGGSNTSGKGIIRSNTGGPGGTPTDPNFILRNIDTTATTSKFVQIMAQGKTTANVDITMGAITWYPGDNNWQTSSLGISTAKAGVMQQYVTLNSDGNVGIGDVNPTAGRLSIAAGAAGNAIYATGTGAFAGFAIRNLGGSASVQSNCFIDFGNELGFANASMATTNYVDGSSEFSFATTPPGARGTDRRVTGMRLSNLGTLYVKNQVQAGEIGAGAAAISPGDASHSGYVRLYKPDGTNQGYIGFAPVNGYITYANEAGGGHTFSGAGGATIVVSQNATEGRYEMQATSRANCNGLLQTYWNGTNSASQLYCYDGVQTIYMIPYTGGVYLPQGGTAWASNSDERLKILSGPLTSAVEKLSSLRTVFGRYKTDADDKVRPFLIAQDVQAVMPEIVQSVPLPNTPENMGEVQPEYLGFAPTDLIPWLIAAVKEQAATISELRDRIAVLEAA